MIPVNKVSLVEDSNDSLNEDNESGPYSILCLETNLTDDSPKANLARYDSKSNLEKENQREEDFGSSKCLYQKFTFNSESKTNSVDNLNRVTFELANNSISTEDLRRFVLAEKSLTRNNLNSSRSSLEENKEVENKTFELKYNTVLSNLKRGANVILTNETDAHENISKSEVLRRTEQLNNPLQENLSYLPINKSCEDLLNDSTTEVKRRKKSNPKCSIPENSIGMRLALDKPSSLPHLRSTHHWDASSSPNNSLLNLYPNHSTPIHSKFIDENCRISDIKPLDEDDASKRNSLEYEESLGILTPDQMIDFSQIRSFSVDYNSLLSSKLAIKIEEKLNIAHEIGNSVESEEIQSPNLNSTTDYSLGIIDVEQLHSTNFLLNPTMNLELFLDSVVNNSKDVTSKRCDQTPSPEELPLDTTPIVESDQLKIEPTNKSKTNNSFITSITSITSLDNGYQGDGEMSRPASRGADNSPLTRRPYPRLQTRRPDPMTDSDFYTESDVDNHEDNQIKGDRRAQVIDGTLYGVDPQATADIYVNNRENMDSSGVFTDIESGLRNDDEVENDSEHVLDVSPSDSSKTISGNSQGNLQEILQNTAPSSEVNDTSLDKIMKENPKKRNAPSPGVSSPSSLSSPRHHSKVENVAKKYKMPKRDVASKVMSNINQSSPGEKKSKPVNRWDAVMNKISKNEQKTNLKDIKSKVFEKVNLGHSANITRTNEQRTTSGKPAANQNNKSRRIRTRTTHNSSPLKKVGSTVESSIHSSLSDLSASASLPKKSSGSAKKREPIQVTQVLTPNKLPPRNQQHLSENKKNANVSPSSSNELKIKRNIFSPKEKSKQQTPAKESSKPTVKGGRVSPSVRPPVPHVPRAPVKRTAPAPRTTEALAVLVQHLVFNVEAYQVPHLRRQVEKFRLEAEEIRLACQNLEEILSNERTKHAKAIEDERVRYRSDIMEIIEKHRSQIQTLTSKHSELEQQLKLEKENTQQYLSQKHEEQLVTLQKELGTLQKSHQESLDILREENESIRVQIDEKRLELEKKNHESMKLKQDYESREKRLREEVEVMKSSKESLKLQIMKLENESQDQIKVLLEENKRLREENDRLLSYGDDKDVGFQEVQSLRAVLELKQNEVAELRKSLGKANQKLEASEITKEKVLALQAKCEDLQHQLQRKIESEQGLIQENVKLQESFKEETNQKRRLSQYNEELQWKLRQHKEVVTKVMAQAEESVFNRSNIYSSSFNEKHGSSRMSLERTLSFKEPSYLNKSIFNLDTSNRSRRSKNSAEFDMDDISPPSSPKVKGVVEKSDSVSYVLDLDESPEVVASRIVRRSFRNTTPPKNTPTKSPSNKRARTRNPLSTSSSSSSNINSNSGESELSKSASGRNGNSDDDVFTWNNNAQSTPTSYNEKLNDSRISRSPGMKLDDDLDDEYNEMELQLPALPSEMDKRNGVLTLPSPKHLAGDAAVSDNSEDESTSSSQL